MTREYIRDPKSGRLNRKIWRSLLLVSLVLIAGYFSWFSPYYFSGLGGGGKIISPAIALFFWWSFFRQLAHRQAYRRVKFTCQACGHVL